jgi:putative SOS response-associated peptidase YedK
MCGRYRLTSKERYIAEHFDLEESEVHWTPHYNIAPTQEAAIVRQDRKQPKRKFSLMRWGLVPSWAKDISIGFKTINAMCETAAEKAAFREAMRKRRCLVPADGFYEWQKLGKKEKQPYNIGMANDSLFAFAGLWERWHDPAGTPLNSFTILTTDANPLVSGIHDRMPVIVKKEDYDLWLDPGMTDPAGVADLLKPFDARLMKKYPVSTRVGNADNDDAEIIKEIVPAAPVPETGNLF